MRAECLYLRIRQHVIGQDLYDVRRWRWFGSKFCAAAVWHLPGGGVERGETAVAAMEREFREEAEIAAAAPLRLHGLYRNAGAAPRDHVAVFVLSAFTVLRDKTPDREIAAFGFFPVDALPEGTTRATAARLREIRQGLAPDPDW